VIFGSQQKLGMLLERHDEYTENESEPTQKVIVKLVVPDGAADQKGALEF